jgi:hypothetical protein
MIAADAHDVSAERPAGDQFRAGRGHVIESDHAMHDSIAE